MTPEPMRIAFAWSGLPDYAARCIRQVIDRYPNRVSVIGTPPKVPIAGMEISLGQEIIWIDGKTDVHWEDLNIPIPDIFFRGGHFVPAFNSLARTARLNGAKIIGTSDATWHGSVRQLFIDPLRHRLLLRKDVDGHFVPGKSGLKHARLMGYPPSKTLPGVLGADPSLFRADDQISKRPKRMIFVGNLNHGKNILKACLAFQRLASVDPSWEFQICGVGDLLPKLPSHPSIKYLGFQQPAQIGRLLAEARVLILPSYAEAWGLVVHEAALSGCALGLSNAVGALEDFATPENAITFPPGSQLAIEQAMLGFAAWSDEQWDRAGEVSRELAQHFGPSHFADSVDQFIAMFGLDRK